MPLYVDSDTLATSFCRPVANAMLEIKSAMEGRGVTPSFALKLINNHLRPLLSEDHKKIIRKRRNPAWNDIFMIYVGLGFESKNGGVVADVMAAIDLIYRYTLITPREFVFPDSVDVSHFLDTCRFLKLSVDELRKCKEDDGFDLFKFCKYCWRLPVPGRKICIVHTSGDNHINQNSIEYLSSKGMERFAIYKEGRRQRELFDKVLNRLITAESIEFHESSFSAQIIPPSSGLAHWLSVRRPNLWAALDLESAALTDSTAVDVLLNILQSTDSLPFSTQQIYQKANAKIKENVILMGPMLARVEAWLIARSESRERWGGTRNNAGRKKVTSR